ncbi:hypothetical protein RCL1_003916 [Eukaryota sp. TZLM3-RCL]
MSSTLCYIDTDNVSVNVAEALLDFIKLQFGNPRIRGFVTRHGSSIASNNWSEIFLKYGSSLEPAQALSSGDNSADLHMIVECLYDVLTSPERSVSRVIIVSSDSDFFPLIHKLRNINIEVFVIGTAKSNVRFRNSCTRFFSLELLSGSLSPSPLSQFIVHLTKISRVPNLESHISIAKIEQLLIQNDNTYCSLVYGYNSTYEILRALNFQVVGGEVSLDDIHSVPVPQNFTPEKITHKIIEKNKNSEKKKKDKKVTPVPVAFSITSPLSFQIPFFKNEHPVPVYFLSSEDPNLPRAVSQFVHTSGSFVAIDQVKVSKKILFFVIASTAFTLVIHLVDNKSLPYCVVQFMELEIPLKGMVDYVTITSRFNSFNTEFCFDLGGCLKHLYYSSYFQSQTPIEPFSFMVLTRILNKEMLYFDAPSLTGNDRVVTQPHAFSTVLRCFCHYYFVAGVPSLGRNDLLNFTRKVVSDDITTDVTFSCPLMASRKSSVGELETTLCNLFSHCADYVLNYCASCGNRFLYSEVPQGCCDSTLLQFKVVCKGCHSIYDFPCNFAQHTNCVRVKLQKITNSCQCGELLSPGLEQSVYHICTSSEHANLKTIFEGLNMISNDKSFLSQLNALVLKESDSIEIDLQELEIDSGSD